MRTTRRSFLIGAGAILTASFVRDARAFASDTGKPYLVAPPQQVGRMLYYEPVEDYWQLSLGGPQFIPPEPPLLIENLRFHGYKLDTQAEIDLCCDETGWTEEDLYAPLDGYSWEDQWEYQFSPAAQAYSFLQEHNLFPRHKGFDREGGLRFVSFTNPMSSARFVEVHDALSISLLQGRLNELGLNGELRPWAG